MAIKSKKNSHVFELMTLFYKFEYIVLIDLNKCYIFIKIS